jgi:hypothetical protein
LLFPASLLVHDDNVIITTVIIRYRRLAGHLPLPILTSYELFFTDAACLIECHPMCADSPVTDCLLCSHKHKEKEECICQLLHHILMKCYSSFFISRDAKTKITERKEEKSRRK